MSYRLTYSFDSKSQSYSVTGYSEITEGDTIIIPDTYNDGTNGKHPVTSIAVCAFDSCKFLSNIVISDSVTSIGESAFYNCTGLKSVIMGKNVTTIEKNAFDSCKALTSITIPDSITSIGSMIFLFCSSLTNVNIPDTVESIGTRAFAYCSNLTNITIPNSVVSIDSSAFAYCSKLTSVTIGNGVTTIASSAFSNCSNLKQMILFPSVPPTLDSTSIPSTISLIYTQESSLEVYKAATNWNTFSSKIVSNNTYLSLTRFNQKNKKYIDTKLDKTGGIVTGKLTTTNGFSVKDKLHKKEIGTIYTDVVYEGTNGYSKFRVSEDTFSYSSNLSVGDKVSFCITKTEKFLGGFVDKTVTEIDKTNKTITVDILFSDIDPIEDVIPYSSMSLYKTTSDISYVTVYSDGIRTNYGWFSFPRISNGGILVVRSELNKKVDKPTTPTEDSVLTYSTSGSVDTKPISEFANMILIDTSLLGG